MAPELFAGFGIVLTESAGLTFIDLDDVRDPESGAIAPWAQQLVDTFNSWREISTSGAGLHIFCVGRLPGAGRSGYLDGVPGQKVEVYDRARFAFLTGHALDPVRPLADRQRLVTLLDEYVCPEDAPMAARGPVARDDTPIRQGARNDQLFRRPRVLLHGLRGAALEAALVAVNRRRCQPPLSAAEVIALARHAERLPDRRGA